MTSYISHTSVDCHDAYAQSQWWKQVLGYVDVADAPLRPRPLEAFPEGPPELVDAWQALHPGEPHPFTFRLHERDEGEAPYCCDYVFVSEDLRPRLKSIMVDGMNRASDHQPVVVELR